MNIQAPPNLSYDEFPRLLDAGINDWGGVSPVTIDHVNPEAPWPEIERLARATRERGLELAPRLPIYPEYVADVGAWCEPRVATAVLRRADASGLAREDGWAAGAAMPIPTSFAPLTSPGSSLAYTHSEASYVRMQDLTPSVGSALAKVREEVALDEDDVTALFEARGRSLDAVLQAADELRREVCGDTVSYVVTRNINYTNVCYFRCGFCAFSKGKLAENLRGPAYVVPLEEIVRRCHEAWERGATEVCLQGGIHPSFTGDYYVEVCEAIKSELPDLHVHAFSALEVWQGAATLGVPLSDFLARLRDVGLASLPGTAAEILDDEVRRVLCPDKVNTAQWLEVHDTAHRAGLRSTTTIMYGSVEGTRSWARHLLAIRDQQVRSGGFTEFVPLPFVHMEAPIYLHGHARPGPTFREAVLMHAVARLALHPHITNVQASWVKLGVDGAAAALRAGANDLGGTLMNESISRAAGASHGQEMPPEAMEAADPIARPHAEAAHHALRHARSRAHAGLVRSRRAGRAGQPEGRHVAHEAPLGPSRAPRPPGRLKCPTSSRSRPDRCPSRRASKRRRRRARWRSFARCCPTGTRSSRRAGAGSRPGCRWASATSSICRPRTRRLSRRPGTSSSTPAGCPRRRSCSRTGRRTSPAWQGRSPATTS